MTILCWQIILGKVVKYSTSLDEQLREQLMDCSEDVPVAVGNTMCTNDFYEGEKVQTVFEAASQKEY